MQTNTAGLFPKAKKSTANLLRIKIAYTDAVEPAPLVVIPKGVSEATPIIPYKVIR